MNHNSEQDTEDSVLASQIKAAGQAYSLSENKARQIINAVHAPTLSPLSSHLKRREQGRSIISNFMTNINVFMSTTAKSGLIILVLGLLGVFGYTQLGTNSSDYAMSPTGAETSLMSAELASDAGAPSSIAAKASPVGATSAQGNGNVDDAVSVMLASSASESLVLGEEDADAALISSDSQELSDFSQSINDDDF